MENYPKFSAIIQPRKISQLRGRGLCTYCYIVVNDNGAIVGDSKQFITWMEARSFEVPNTMTKTQAMRLADGFNNNLEFIEKYSAVPVTDADVDDIISGSYNLVKKELFV